eukprot:TRINITY_DN75008_c0_g1_i1.p1 TRINITY_DN75008_c0_g1~~TRINITY_DN75008_c0_g1_i1.p1  ORF type:complete len:513 (-),score=61.84 TRINITY_DN75008_c0_g1_i1:156-1694(-)
MVRCEFSGRFQFSARHGQNTGKRCRALFGLVTAVPVLVAPVQSAAAAATLEPRHVEFEGSAYQDYKHPSLRGGSEKTLHGRKVRLMKLPTYRLFGLDTAVNALNQRQAVGPACVAGEGTPEPQRSHCKQFHVYNPTLAVLEAESGVSGILVMARVSNWSLCSWSGGGRPYADYTQSVWPNANFEEYHSHLTYMVLPYEGLANASLGSIAHIVPQSMVTMDGSLWRATRAPFFEIFRQGLEDPRLIQFGGVMKAIVSYGMRAARKEPTRLADRQVEGVGAFRQAILTLPDLGSRTAPGVGVGLEDFVALHTDFGKDTQQKNWMPFVHGRHLYAVYQLAPTVQVVTLDDAIGSALLTYETEAPAPFKSLQRGDVRGGSQIVHVPGTRLYLGVAHIARGRSMYTHFFFVLEDEPPFAVKGVSREWCFAHEETFQTGAEMLCEGVQFVSGLALVGPPGGVLDTALMTFGTMDCDARLARTPLRTVMKSIQFEADGTTTGDSSSASEDSDGGHGVEL